MQDQNDSNDRLDKSKAELVVLVVLLLVFLAYSIFVAIKLDTGIIPDEIAHFVFSKHYATTLGIPPDTVETYSWGWYIDHNPFLYYWINARVINLSRLIQPTITDAALLLILRLLSSLYSIGTLIFLYLLSKLVIQKRWWQLLPVFLLTNTLMFVFLSGGVNYDNLAYLFCTAGIYYLIRVIVGQDFVTNTMAWMVFICLGCLVKYTILPLALFSFLIWIFFTIKHRKAIFPITKWSPKKTILALILVPLIIGNLSIYGYNLIVFKAVTPRCADLLTESQCALSPFAQRYETYGLEKPMSLVEAVQQGFPNPLSYLIDFWIKDMLNKTYGILAHKWYVPSHIIPFFQLFYLGVLFLAFQNWKGVNFQRGSLLFLIILYSLIVFRTNYKSELAYNFQHFVLQGRYLFPIIGLIYVLIGYTLSQVSHKMLRYAVAFATIVLFLAGGPLKFIKLYNTVFASWFVH